MHSRNHDYFYILIFIIENIAKLILHHQYSLQILVPYLLYSIILFVQPLMITEQMTRRFEERVKKLTQNNVMPIQQPQHSSIDKSFSENQSLEEIPISIASSNQYLTKQSVSEQKINRPSQNQEDILKPGSSEKNKESLNQSQKLIVVQKLRKLLNQQKNSQKQDDDLVSEGKQSSQNSPQKKEQNPTRRSQRILYKKNKRNFASFEEKPKNQKSRLKPNSEIVDMSSDKKQSNSFCSVHLKTVNNSLKNTNGSYNPSFQLSQSHQPMRQINPISKKIKSQNKKNRGTNKKRQLQVVQVGESPQIEGKEQGLNQTQKKQVQGIIEKFMENLTAIITPVIINQLGKKNKSYEDDNTPIVSQPKQKFRSDNSQTQHPQSKQFSNFFIKNPYPDKILQKSFQSSISSSSHQPTEKTRNNAISSQNSQKQPKYDKKTMNIVKQMEQKLKKIEREQFELTQGQMKTKLVTEALIFLRKNKIDKPTQQMIIKQWIQQSKMKYFPKTASGYKWL